MIKFQRRAAFALLAAAALLAPASAPAQTSQARSSANLELVAQGITGQGGTDLEFFSRELSVYMDKDKNMVPADPPVERHFAMVGNQTSGAKIVDITDPTAPYIVSGVENCTVGQGDIQVTDDGTKAAIAFQTSGNCRRYDNRTLQRGSILVDLTDVYAPIVAGGAAEPSGSHNNTLHPSGDYLYISTSNLAETSGKGRVPIFDVRDPYNPVKVTDFRFDAPNSPHDIRFSDDGERAYFAGISTYSIVNTEDPTKPSIISRIVPPGGTIGHDTLVTPDKAFLFLGDEAGGGSTYPCPGGAIYVYDIRTEAAPILLGAVEAGGGPVTGRDLEGTGGANRTGGCTAHVMDLNPDGKSLTIGWYVLGTRTFDFSGLYNEHGHAQPLPALAWGRFGATVVEDGWIVPADNAVTWSAKQYEKVPCYIFSDDTQLGLYVTRIKDCEPPTPEPEPSPTST